MGTAGTHSHEQEVTAHHQGDACDYRQAVDELIGRQLREWPAVRANYAALDREVRTRRLQLGASTIVLQHNPGRRRSSAARIDAPHPCFLCDANQPPEQGTLKWRGKYKIQVNPYPIFPRHLTIASLHHEPQRIAGRIGDMLRLAEDLPEFVIFYNGPHCGASAPCHFHFQAGNKDFLPLCDEVYSGTISLLAEGDDGMIGLVEGLGRSVISIETRTRAKTEDYFNRLLLCLPKHGEEPEPMVNVLCWHNPRRNYHTVVFPRIKHRPDCYGTGPGQLLLSPASVDMGGVWAVPRLNDYETLTARQVQHIYDELCMSCADIHSLFRQLKNDIQSTKTDKPILHKENEDF